MDYIEKTVLSNNGGGRTVALHRNIHWSPPCPPS